MSILSSIESFQYFYAILDTAFVVIISSIIYLIFAKFIEKISKIKTRYTMKKFIALVIILIDFIIVVSIFVKNTSIVIVSAGLFSAGIAFSLRDPITSLIAWFVIIFLRPFSIGERIKIGNEEGDVVDINAFFFTLMEINQWTSADLYTGRLVEVPNNQIMTAQIVNFSKGFNYLWDNIDVPVFYNSDIDQISSMLKEIAKSVTEKYFEKATKEYTRLKKKYFIERGIFEPRIFVSFNDNYALLSLRYITDLWERKTTETEISTEILRKFKLKGIQIASSSLIVSNKSDLENGRN
ncbi:MAG: mechanosensitive ion channel family protein [Thermoplasmatales archaeon]|nr:mechanosensitive ion channel family protein [Thermoplasmatales archaeon]MCW6170713.1 mechanosensitive ion channel family protein [Thermoplasmatales archaeon]